MIGKSAILLVTHKMSVLNTSCPTWDSNPDCAGNESALSERVCDMTRAGPTQHAIPGPAHRTEWNDLSLTEIHCNAMNLNDSHEYEYFVYLTVAYYNSKPQIKLLSARIRRLVTAIDARDWRLETAAREAVRDESADGLSALGSVRASRFRLGLRRESLPP
jgi:hypothetical protein